MRATNQSRLLFLFSAIAGMIRNPLSGQEEVFRANKREVHFMIGESPIYFPQRKKLKGYKKEANRKKHYNKFKTY